MHFENLKYVCGQAFTLDPAAGAYSTPSDPLAAQRFVVLFAKVV